MLQNNKANKTYKNDALCFNEKMQWRKKKELGDKSKYA